MRRLLPWLLVALLLAVAGGVASLFNHNLNELQRMTREGDALALRHVPPPPSTGDAGR